jgi:hypothetical protein
MIQTRFSRPTILLAVLLSAGLLAANLLAACAPAATAAPTQPAPTALPTSTTAPTAAPSATSAPMVAPSSTPAVFTDPFAYCQFAGTVDKPGPEYTGEKMPDGLAMSLRKASGGSDDMPLDLVKNGSSWRCMDGKVYGCFVGANLPCDAKANTDKTPIQAETDFCKANPGADIIPAVVTGHETIYEWHCNQDTPEVGKQVFQVDPRGYIAEIWYPLSAQ